MVFSIVINVTIVINVNIYYVYYYGVVSLFKKIDRVDDKHIYSFVAGAFFMASSLIIPISIAYANSGLGFYGAVCLLISLYYVNQFRK